MRLRDALVRSLGPGSFAGVSLGTWFRILRDVGFSIDWPYWPRATVITVGAIPNTLVGWCESCLYDRKIEATLIEPPVFVLGAWRSGTTHLHNLLSLDDRFAFPNLYQVSFPSTFLVTERTNAWLMNLLLPESRPQDNVKLGIAEPQEEEYAMSSICGRSVLLAMAFPRRADVYANYLTLCGLTDEQLDEWKAGYVWFLKKLTFKHRRPLVLKSPGHTGRIRILLELFPEAKFVHIHRHPYDVHRSALHTQHTASPWWRFQRGGSDGGDEWLINRYRDTYAAFFAEQPLIPPGSFHEIAFTDLERDPIGEIQHVYQALDLPDFSHVEEKLRRYVGSLSDYRKNVLDPLPEIVRRRIASECPRCFEVWGYEA
jgi:hypothetical protein